MTATERPTADNQEREGVYLVTTETGSRYRIDPTRMTAVRYPDLADGHGQLRRDEEERPLLEIGPIHIGRPMVLALDIRSDGVITFRTTSWVTAIERLQ